VRKEFEKLMGDDKILFARGGVWIETNMELQNFNASAAHPITFDAYSPAWGATRRPILKEMRRDLGIFWFMNGGDPVPDGGYVVRNLDLRGSGADSVASGIFTSAKTSDILLSNLNVEGFAEGMHCGDAIERVTLRDSTFRNNVHGGVFWSCNNSVIENNLFDHNGTNPSLDHSIYISAVAGAPTNIVVRNNTLTNNILFEGKCTANPMVVHGVVDGLTIEGNLIQQDPGAATAGCWGIAVDPGDELAESFKRVVIRGNHVVNVGGIGIGCAACIAPVIENNVIISSDPNIDDFIGISVPDLLPGPGDAADTGAIIRNNSIYFAATPPWSVGIWVGERGVFKPGKDIQVVSNLIRFGSGSPNAWCFNLAGTQRSDFKAFDNNLCHHVGTGRYSDTFATLADAKAQNFDRNGLSADPQIAAAPSQANGWSLALGAGSPARDAGHARKSAVRDILKVRRTDADIGAYEFVPPPTR
jgi:hypothetical protein